MYVTKTKKLKTLFYVSLFLVFMGITYWILAHYTQQRTNANANDSQKFLIGLVEFALPMIMFYYFIWIANLILFVFFAQIIIQWVNWKKPIYKYITLIIVAILMITTFSVAGFVFITIARIKNHHDNKVIANQQLQSSVV